ncbi:MAG TPA: TetR/AcrR family transcriptional regulator [Spirochaetia bacterium]|nr:TetR/AcrR family transcriptional regulator [Spirochaetia bacterium]
MPKGFSEREKTLIRQKLIEAGKKIFGTYGFKKASIDEAVAAAGISKGSFYQFFSSKAEFFMEVLESVEQETRSELNEILADGTLSPAARFKNFLHTSLQVMEQNPITSRIRQEDLHILLADMPEGRLEEHMEHDMNFMLHFFREFKAGGGRKIPTAALKGFFMFLFFIFQHKGDLAEEEYRAGMDLFIDMTARYFFPEYSVE